MEGGWRQEKGAREIAMITASTQVVRAESLLSTELDDETILMSIERGAYYGMEQTARRIWALLGEPRTVSEICAQLAQEYDVAPDRCQQDITPFLEELQREGLVVVT